MPNYIPNSQWPDAMAYGQGLGQSLTQGLMEQPMRRFQLAQQLAQVQRQHQQYQQQAALAQQQAQQQAHYQNNMLGFRQQELGQQQNRLTADQGHWQDQLLVELQKLRDANMNKGVVLPPGSSYYRLNQEQPQNSVNPLQQPTVGSLSTNNQGIANTQGMGLPLMQPIATNTNAPSRALNQVTPDANMNLIARMAPYMVGANGTNMTPQQQQFIGSMLGPVFSNAVQRAQSPGMIPTPAAADRVRNWNPATGQLE